MRQLSTALQSIETDGIRIPPPKRQESPFDLIDIKAFRDASAIVQSGIDRQYGVATEAP
jgi:hypothetical protein